MANLKHKILLLTIGLAMPFLGLAQTDALEETFFQSGKMPVVVAVIAIILVGFFIYLFVIDRKVSRIEKSIKGNS